MTQPTARTGTECPVWCGGNHPHVPGQHTRHIDSWAAAPESYWTVKLRQVDHVTDPGHARVEVHTGLDLLTPDEARDLAAAVLRAADVAEGKPETTSEAGQVGYIKVGNATNLIRLAQVITDLDLPAETSTSTSGPNAVRIQFGESCGDDGARRELVDRVAAHLGLVAGAAIIPQYAEDLTRDDHGRPNWHYTASGRWVGGATVSVFTRLDKPPHTP
jgi:hypothetical protein